MVRFVDDGGEHLPLAPVIPLFGGAAAVRSASAAGDRPLRDDAEDGGDPSAVWHSSWLDDRRAGSAADVAHEPAEDASDAVAAAEKQLLKKLRTRSLSVTEARSVLAQHAVDPSAIETLIEDFLRRGYLDDAALAEQLVHVGVDRKGQGRQVIARTLSTRGIPRDMVDAALAALPDDEAERALEFARSRAARLSDLDESTALRRLVGQLARRGYGGSAATAAARTALAEGRGGSSGVRFR